MTDLIQAKELVQQGIAAAKAGQKEKAHQLLLQAIELDERNEQAWLWLSGLVESPDEKRICLENALAINPNNTHARAGLHWLEQSTAPPPSPASAQEQCPHCGAEVPPSGTTCPHCGQPLLVACPSCGEYVDVREPACPDCGQALGDFHEGARYHLALAHAYLERRRKDLAEEAVAWAEASAGDDPQLLESVATLYEKTGSMDRATAAYERALAQDPNNASLYAGLGAIYRRRSQPEEARAMYEKAAQLAGNDPTILFELAQLSYEEQGPAPEVSKLLQRVIQKQPMNAQAFVLLGDVYLAQDRHKQARQQYTHACQLTSPSSEVGQQARRKLLEIESPGSYHAAGEWTAGRQPISPGLRKRPGCITVYAFLIGLSAVFGLLSIFVTAAWLFGNRAELEDLLRTVSGNLPLNSGQFATMAGVYFVFLLIVSTINLAIAVGLWNMKNWARIIEIIRQVLGFVGSLLVGGLFLITFRQTLVQYGVTSYPALFLFILFVGFVIQGYFIFWFVANRELFD